MQPDSLSPHEWLKRQPLQPSEQLFAIFGNASAARPLDTWQRPPGAQAPRPVWADTAYADWKPVMPYVGIVPADGEFLHWIAKTDSRDWGWLAVSSAPPERVVEHLRSLTQIILPDASVVFFRFWDGCHLLPILQSPEVNAALLLAVFSRCLINGQALETGGTARATAGVFPWWEVPATLLTQLSQHSNTTLVDNLLKWLSEERPDLFEAFSTDVLRHKVAIFLEAPDLPTVPKTLLVDFLTAELG